MTDLIEPFTQHKCQLPDPTYLKDGTLARCGTPGCGRWSYKWTDYAYWVADEWARVRWYHFSKKRRIRLWLEE
jgi:hypothetical protein